MDKISVFTAAWSTRYGFDGWVCCEDQFLFYAGIYAEQVVREHNKILEDSL